MNKTPDAFTLIELLAVMAITAVLAALIFPLVSMARMAGWRATSTSNLRQLYIANATYAVDNKRYVPTGAWPDNDHRWCGRRNSMSDPWDPTKGLLSPWFGKSNKVNACPLLRRMLDTQDSSITSFEANGGGYGYNDYIGGVVPGEISWTVPQKFGFYIGARPNAIINPARTVMFTTSAYATSSGGGGGGGKKQGLQEYPFSHPPLKTKIQGPGRFSPSTHFRFNGKALVAWCDGHVSAEKLEPRDVGENPHGGDAEKFDLGWFGPDENNGYWNPYSPADSGT